MPFASFSGDDCVCDASFIWDTSRDYCIGKTLFYTFKDHSDAQDVIVDSSGSNVHAELGLSSMKGEATDPWPIYHRGYFFAGADQHIKVQPYTGNSNTFYIPASWSVEAWFAVRGGS